MICTKAKKLNPYLMLNSMFNGCAVINVSLEPTLNIFGTNFEHSLLLNNVHLIAIND